MESISGFGSLTGIGSVGAEQHSKQKDLQDMTGVAAFGENIDLNRNSSVQGNTLDIGC